MNESSQSSVDDVAAEKRVSWAELFFDLVFVVAVTRVSILIEHDHGWGGLLRALVVFVPIYWMWVGMAIQANRYDTGAVWLRVRMFAVALCGVFMALSLDEAYGRLGSTFALAYWIGRLILAAGFVGTPVKTVLTSTPYGISLLVSGPLLAFGAQRVDVDARTAVWGLAALIDLASPTYLRSRLREMRVDPGHLSERFGLFVLIALGESVVAVGTTTSAEELGVIEGVAIAAAFVLVCGLWWVYFHFAADAVRHSLTTASVQLDIVRLVLSYGHLAFIAAVILVSVGMRESIAHPAAPLSWAFSGLLAGGTALYLASFGFTRWAMFHQISWTRLGAAGAALLVIPIGPHVPALASVSCLAAVLVGLNLGESRIIARRVRLSSD